MTEQTTSIQDAVRGFSEAETALRALLASADQFSDASEQVDIAHGDLTVARESVQESTKRLTLLAKDFDAVNTALKKATQALNRVEPDRIVTATENTQAAVAQVGTDLTDAMDDQQNELSRVITKGHDELRQATIEAHKEVVTVREMTLKSARAVGSSLSALRSDQESMASDLSNAADASRERDDALSKAVTTGSTKLDELLSQQATANRRQDVMLWLVCAAAALAGACLLVQLLL